MVVCVCIQLGVCGSMYAEKSIFEAQLNFQIEACNAREREREREREKQTEKEKQRREKEGERERKR